MYESFNSLFAPNNTNVYPSGCLMPGFNEVTYDYHGFNQNAQDFHMFGFNERAAQEIAPSVWLGPHECLSSGFMNTHDDVKIVINCGDTCTFLGVLDSVPLSSDVMVLSLDPGFLDERANTSDRAAQLTQFVTQFNRILQNYLTHFYTNNPESVNLIHDLPQNNQLALSSPILAGNLQAHFFNLTRLIKLFKTINPLCQILVVSETGNMSISTALCIAYLMDTYNYNIESAFRFLTNARPSVRPLNYNFYDDLLMIESLKKFAAENRTLKEKKPGLLMANCKLKRRQDEVDYVSVSGKRKR